MHKESTQIKIGNTSGSHQKGIRNTSTGNTFENTFGVSLVMMLLNGTDPHPSPQHMNDDQPSARGWFKICLAVPGQCGSCARLHGLSQKCAQNIDQVTQCVVFFHLPETTGMVLFRLAHTGREEEMCSKIARSGADPTKQNFWKKALYLRQNVCYRGNKFPKGASMCVQKHKRKGKQVRIVQGARNQGSERVRNHAE